VLPSSGSEGLRLENGAKTDLSKNMSNTPKRSAFHAGVEFAAGGLVWHGDGAGRRLAVVHRAKYQDWTLPKGRLEWGETLAETAVREAEEETGWKAIASQFAGSVSYLKEDHPKVVLLWHMKRGPIRRKGFPNKEEVDDVAWLKPEQAIHRLSHPGEKDFVTRQCLELESMPPSQTPEKALNV
jgi:8-oxo-dGTP pyrophosphatase MutT (NUDIX family)